MNVIVVWNFLFQINQLTNFKYIFNQNLKKRNFDRKINQVLVSI